MPKRKLQGRDAGSCDVSYAGDPEANGSPSSFLGPEYAAKTAACESTAAWRSRASSTLSTSLRVRILRAIVNGCNCRARVGLHFPPLLCTCGQEYDTLVGA